MTLNSVIALILRFSLNSIALLANSVSVVEDNNNNDNSICIDSQIVSPIMSVNILSVPVFHFWSKPTLQRGLSVTAELLVM